jgi:hypothetical protein
VNYHDTIDPNRLYTRAFCGRYFGLCANSIYKMIRAGVLDARKIGRVTRITGASIIDAPNKLPRVGNRAA